jgi:hypothetical protein
MRQAQRIKVSHSHGNRAEKTMGVNDEPIMLRIGAALAVGSTEVLGHWSKLLK